MHCYSADSSSKKLATVPPVQGALQDDAHRPETASDGPTAAAAEAPPARNALEHSAGPESVCWMCGGAASGGADRRDCAVCAEAATFKVGLCSYGLCNMAYVVMACIVMAYIAMAYVVMAYTVMAYVAVACFF